MDYPKYKIGDKLMIKTTKEKVVVSDVWIEGGRYLVNSRKDTCSWWCPEELLAERK